MKERIFFKLKGFFILASTLAFSGCLGDSERRILSLTGKKGTFYKTMVDVMLLEGKTDPDHGKDWDYTVSLYTGFRETPLLPKGSILKLERIDVDEYYLHRTFLPFFAPKVYRSAFILKEEGKNRTMEWVYRRLLEARRTPDPIKQEEEFSTMLNDEMSKEIAPISKDCIKSTEVRKAE